MPNLDEASSARDEKLEQVLAEYLRSAERGENPDRQAFVAAHPDLADELRSFFHSQDALQRMAAPLRAAALDPTLPGLEQTAPTPGTLLRYFGDYELLAEIARGGMGVVYKARQVSLNRIVALKMILAGQLASPQDVERFHLEAEAAANLDHPGIVPIYEVGEHERQHFFSMAFVDGPSLAQRLTVGPLPPVQAAELIRKVAEAVAFAHTRGVIHRDLKPGNILLDADGQPRITDFGLAKRIAGDKQLTATGQVLGTPSFMPPEQASGDGGQIDGAADVYALGAVLYALLVGRPPFQADNPIDTVLQVLHREAVAPRQLNARIPRDLETICLKCLRKSPRRRYSDAAALADDLQRFLNHRPIRARPVGVVERTAKWVRRRPALAALIVVAAVGFAGVTWQWRVSTHERRTVERLLDASEAQRYVNEIGWADREWADGDLDRADSILVQCPAQRRGWEWYYLRRLCHPELLSIETGAVNSVAFSPDGSLLAIPSNRSTPERMGFLWNSAKRVLVFDAATGERVWTSAEHKHQVLTARFSRDGEWLISAGGILAADGKGEGEVQLQQLKSDVVSLTYSGHDSWVQSAEMHPDGVRVASIDQSGVIKLWSATDGAELASWKVPGGRFSSGLAFDRRGEKLAAVSSGSNRVYVWKLDSPDHPTEYVGHQHNILGNVDFSPDGRLLAAGDMNNTVIVWDVATGAVKHRFADAGREVRFSPDGAQLATTEARIEKQVKAIRIWDLAEGSLLRTLPGGFNCLDFAADGKRIASASFGGTVKIWDANATPGVRRLDVQTFAWGGQFGFVGEAPTIVVPDQETRFYEKVTFPGGSSVNSYSRRTIA
ncbi:MAG TPA: protein kinase, partial [Pirellulales bacterium]|nr:protein kinase [Pirellulales bacterium]